MKRQVLSPILAFPNAFDVLFFGRLRRLVAEIKKGLHPSPTQNTWFQKPVDRHDWGSGQAVRSGEDRMPMKSDQKGKVFQ
jgi:hypothetical protein